MDMRRLALLLLALFCLTGCSVMDELGTSTSAVKPDLALLHRPEYTAEAVSAFSPQADASAMKLDLWLDATQVMGGINPNEESMYPHASKKYREGGFHYRYEDRTGMYESVLHCMLASAEGSRVRLLRYGNERLTDDFLIWERVADRDASAEQLRSLRRDMLTYAIDPLPSVFSHFSGEKMEDSFYSLHSPAMNRIGTLKASLLENPDRADHMQDALDANDIPAAFEQDDDSALLYALDNLDLSRLSVITCDPAAIRRLTVVEDDGTPVKLIARLMEERGVFDAGLSVGLYAFKLDYMGQMISFGPVDLSEPIIWGRLNYSDRKKQSTGELVMPRTMLTLVVGQSGDVEAFTSALNAEMAACAELNQLRGPEKGELTYTKNGQTITQQPFRFESHYTQIERPAIGCITQHTPGELSCAQGSVTSDGGLQLVTLSGAEDAAITLTLPIAALPDGVTADLSQLEDISLTAEGTLVHVRTEENTGENAFAENEQSITLRDQVYVFAPETPAVSPFTFGGVGTDGGELTLSMQADASLLKPGYYRVSLSADLTGGMLSWEHAEWISELDAAVTNAQIDEWEAFSELLSEYERKRDNPSRGFTHAWGGAENDTYRGVDVPDLPPVTQALWLDELTAQLAEAADVDRIPYLRYVFDVFVTGGWQ